MSTEKSCRILVTTKCNLDCSYCCNKRKDIQDKFKRVHSLHEIPLHLYENINISGGEPTLNGARTAVIAKYIANNISPMLQSIYLYTNGTLPVPRNLFRWIDGVNIGVHDSSLLNIMSMLDQWVHSPIDNIRLLVQDINVTAEIAELCSLTGVTLVPWVLNDCDQPNEDWYTLEEFADETRL